MSNLIQLDMRTSSDPGGVVDQDTWNMSLGAKAGRSLPTHERGRSPFLSWSEIIDVPQTKCGCQADEKAWSCGTGGVL